MFLALKADLRTLMRITLILCLSYGFKKDLAFGDIESQTFSSHRAQTFNVLSKNMFLFPAAILSVSAVNILVLFNFSRKSLSSRDFKQDLFYNEPKKEPIKNRTSNSLHVLHVSLEYKGAMIGGIGSVTKSLVPSFNKKNSLDNTGTQKIDAAIALPAYSFFKYQEDLLQPMTQVSHFYNGQLVKSKIFKVQSHDQTLNTTVYIVSPDEQYRDIFKIPSEKDLYTYAANYQPIERWLYFDTAIAAFISQYTLPETNTRFDIVHFHSYHTAAAILYLDLYNNNSFQKNDRRPKTIFHMHSLSYDQGWVQKELLTKTKLETQIEWENLTARTMGRADCVLTVSKAMLTQGLDPDQKASFGLFESFHNANTNGYLKFINNGINIENFDPKNKNILLGKNGEDLTFSHTNIKQGKLAIKKYLTKNGHFIKSDSPLFAFVGRFSDEKGIELLPGAVQTIINLGGQVAIMGEYTKSNNSKYFINELKKQAKTSFAGKLLVLDSKQDQTKDNLGNLIRAASDFSLVPSHEESFGLVPLEFFAFGTMAIASDAGGLRDNIIPFIKGREFYNGFSFPDDDPDQLYWSIHQAFKLMQERPDEFEYLRKKVLETAPQYDWLAENGSVDKLVSLYQGLMHAQP